MITKILDKLKHYLELQADIVKLSVVERVAVVMSFILFLALCTVFGITIFIMTGMALASYMAEWLSSPFLGHLVVVGIYLVILLLIIANKKRITNSFVDMFIKLMSETEENIKSQNKNE